VRARIAGRAVDFGGHAEFDLAAAAELVAAVRVG
jgi:hypothetical protein